jgi:Tol biopolymer transport system component
MTELLGRLQSALAGRYTIERELGRGGMATVYLATDLKHHRPVALKVLRPELAAALGPDRFLREIEVASKLTHPHILPVYDSGRTGGRPDGSAESSANGQRLTANDFLYYVMPYVEGESLRDRLIREKQLPLDDALQISREVADALSYAHSHGVIHRDIKPENILLESGHAVVADFGIARAIDQAGGDRITGTGVALGTPAYMSPEQAAGSKDLDGRSDLYSLGCVLYEMLAGQPPFAGPTLESVIHQHLTAEPPSITVIRPAVPGWVAAALARSLAKTPADRFNPVAQFAEAIVPRVGPTAADVRPPPVAASTRRWLAPAVLAALALVVVAVTLFRITASRPITITASNIVQVTSEPGLEFQPAISPDGEDVAYVVGPIGSPGIVVRSAVAVGTGGQTRLGDEVGGRQWLPSWTPDGASLRFLRCGLATMEVVSPLASSCEWREVGKLGGAVRAVHVRRVSDRAAWSPDGRRVAFAVGDSIFSDSADGGSPQLLGVHRVAPWTPHSLAWSPDGRLIAYVNGNPHWRTSANVSGASIWMLDAAGGEPVQVTDEAQMNVSPQWRPDSRHLLFVSNRDGPRGIYVVEVGPDGPRGSPRSVPGSSDPHSISVSRDGRRLAYSKFSAAQNIWSVRLPRAGVASIRDAVPVTKGNQIIEEHGLSPDGEWIVYDGTRRGNADLYRMPLRGGDPQMIVDLPDDAFAPDWSPDGTEIAFYGNAVGGTGHIWVVPVEGGKPTQLTNFPGTFSEFPDWSPDGLHIAFESRGPRAVRPYDIWVVSRDDVGRPWGAPVQLTDFGCRIPDWAPDGASLVCYAGDELVRVSREGQVLARYGFLKAGLRGIARPQFSPDGSRIYFLATEEDGSQGVWWVLVSEGEPAKAVAFDDLAVVVLPFLTVGPRSLYLTIAQYESDIWVMDLDW